MSNTDKNKRFAEMLGLDSFSLEAFSLKNISILNTCNNSNKEDKDKTLEGEKTDAAKRIYKRDSSSNSLEWRKMHDDPIFQTVLAWGFEAKVLFKRINEYGAELVKKACKATIAKADSYFRQDGTPIAKQRVFVLVGTIKNLVAELVKPAEAKPAEQTETVKYYYPQVQEPEPEPVKVENETYAQVLEVMAPQLPSKAALSLLKTAKVTRIDREAVEVQAISPVVSLIKNSYWRPFCEALESVFGKLPMITVATL